MEECREKKAIKVYMVDAYIQRYRENIRLQDQLESRRKSKLFIWLFKWKIRRN